MRKKKVTSEGRFSELMEEAQFYFLNQNYDEAQRLLEEALKIKPDARALYTLGLIFEIKNEKEKAQEMYRSALELEPNLKEAEEHLAKILKG
jgi:tetratricopeptide (TPR) repeat protein|uniref:Tetratricopeptide repeat protein n=1 Tax=candidate division WOR-3 bacterium TaxID=2052148 RepID=A0A7C3UQB6_UNCW3